MVYKELQKRMSLVRSHIFSQNSEGVEVGEWGTGHPLFPHTVVFFTVLIPFSKRSCHKKPLSIGSYSKSFGNDDLANTVKQNSETIPVISDQISSICPLELRVFKTVFHSQDNAELINLREQ